MSLHGKIKYLTLALICAAKTLLPRLIHEAQRRVKLHTLNRAPPEPQSAWPTLRGGANASGPSASMDSYSNGKDH